MSDRARQAEFERLSQMPRYTPTTTTLLGVPIDIVDATSFLWTLPDIFDRGMLAFRASSSTPVIIDGGANIGLATLFFKRLYPQSRITVFEPDAEIFTVLRRNLLTWGYPDVVCHCAALAAADGVARFNSERADSGRIVDATTTDGTVPIRTLRLSSFLTEPVDMLKLDIEGAEVDVLEECVNHLHLVRQVYISYHSFKQRPQRLDAVIGCLGKGGFRVYPDDRKVDSPLIARQEYRDIEFVTGLFGFRVPR
jgi:FkbM family methyltransferase